MSWAEYQQLCPKAWTETYGNQRCHLWDTADVRLKGMPSNALYAHLTFSKYYGRRHVCKAGIGCIPGGWCMGASLWTGGISDTSYMKQAGILGDQRELQEQDSGPAITNVTDKGMKSEYDAWEAGKQCFLTPSFRHSSQKQLLRGDAYRTTLIAADRAQNERMVRLVKNFGYVMNYIDLREPTVVANMIWMNICFRVNFVYQPLHV